jgi:hypothetical protein
VASSQTQDDQQKGRRPTEGYDNEVGVCVTVDCGKWWVATVHTLVCTPTLRGCLDSGSCWAAPCTSTTSPRFRP